MPFWTVISYSTPPESLLLPVRRGGTGNKFSLNVAVSPLALVAAAKDTAKIKAMKHCITFFINRLGFLSKLSFDPRMIMGGLDGALGQSDDQSYLFLFAEGLPVVWVGRQKSKTMTPNASDQY